MGPNVSNFGLSPISVILEVGAFLFHTSTRIIGPNTLAKSQIDYYFRYRVMILQSSTPEPFRVDLLGNWNSDLDEI